MRGRLRKLLSKKLAGRRVLVSGGAGFIGSEVTEQLCRGGAEVTVFDNLSSGKIEYVSSSKQIRLIRGDVCNRQKVAAALKDQEIAIHLAALPFIPDSYYYPEDFFRVNTMGTVSILSQCIHSESVERFVHVSSSEVYGTAMYTPMDEKHPTLPHSTYAVSKLAADRAAFTMHKEHGFPIVIVRPFNTYGPRVTQPYIIPEIASQLLKGCRTLKLGNVKAVRDFTYVADMANALVLASMEKDVLGETINVGTGRGASIRTVAMLLAKILRRDVHINVDKKRLRPYDVEKLVCDFSKAQRILRWSPTIPLREGLTTTLNWLRAHPVRYKTSFGGWPRAYRDDKNPG